MAGRNKFLAKFIYLLCFAAVVVVVSEVKGDSEFEAERRAISIVFLCVDITLLRPSHSHLLLEEKKSGGNLSSLLRLISSSMQIRMLRISFLSSATTARIVVIVARSSNVWF